MSGTTTATRSRRPPASKPSRPAPDPRIEARRRAVARDEGRKRLRLLIALSMITLIAIGAMVALQSEWLDVDEIVVEGVDRTAPDEVRTATAIELGSPLVDVDLLEAIRGVETLPWVALATAERSWNGTVTIVVTERTPVIALPSADGAFMYVDATGRQLASIPERPDWSRVVNGLVVNGVAGEPAPTEIHGVLRLLEMMTADQLASIRSVSVADGRLLLDRVEGGTVDLGTDSGLAAKLVSYDTIRASVDLRCLHRIDLRVPDAPAITRVTANGETGRALSDMVSCT